MSYEVSGNFNALKTCVAATKRGGVIVQVGTLPHEPLPFVVNELMAKELDLRGAFRWGIEFDWAVDYLSSRRVDVRPLLSGQYPLKDAVAAFARRRGQEQEHQGPGRLPLGSVAAATGFHCSKGGAPSSAPSPSVKEATCV